MSVGVSVSASVSKSVSVCVRVRVGQSGSVLPGAHADLANVSESARQRVCESVFERG